MPAENCIERLSANSAAPLDIADEVFDHEIPRRVLQTYLSDPRHILIIARDGTRIVGQARGIVHLHPDASPTLYVDNLGVAPAYRRTGIATKLMRELLRIGKQAGCHDFWLGSESDDEVATAFYRSLGLTGRSVTYFEGKT